MMAYLKGISGLLLLLAVVVLAACSSYKDEPLFFNSKRPAGESEAPVKEVPADILSSQRAFSLVAKKVTPAVVNISSESIISRAPGFLEINPLFEELFGPLPRVQRSRSLGSGFIISHDGYIVTNYHVVRNADSIQVKLSNDRIYSARVVGGDPKTDIAVIKILATDLPVVVLGDSDKLDVGHWAIAIGNPFGLERSMTVGVISATGRSNVGIEPLENFIQTDASINPGNSGGPLLNVHGEVIGINTAIVASGQGIGFAIPVNMAKPIIETLVAKGSVSRGWLGIGVRPLTHEQAKALGLNQLKGAIVYGLYQGGPAEAAGIRPGDLILSFNGQELKDAAHMMRLVAESKIGSIARLKVFRDGRTLEFAIKLEDDRISSRQRRVKSQQ